MFLHLHFFEAKKITKEIYGGGIFIDKNVAFFNKTHGAK